MRYLFLLLFLPALAFAQSDSQLLEAQRILKNQGDYFGSVDGVSGRETSAAIRRYQIRKGLDITGQLNEETRLALQNETTSTNAVSETTFEKDRAFLEQDNPPVSRTNSKTESVRTTPDTNSENGYLSSDPIPAGQSPDTFSESEQVIKVYSFREVFRNSPYANAPHPIQKRALGDAQDLLKIWGYYAGSVDEEPGPATKAAILRFQKDYDLPPTGILDRRTLARMNLLPARNFHSGRHHREPFRNPPTLREIWGY